VTDDITKQHYARQLGELSVIRRHSEFQTKTLQEHGQLLAGLNQRCQDRGRRLCALEDWCESKDDLVTATGRHDITRLEAQLDEMKAKKAARVRWIAGIVGTVIAGGILAWATAVFAGCTW